MFDQLLAVLRYSGVIAITILMTNSVLADSTEYVFSAPPEVDNDLQEIPTSETEYPFYECDDEEEYTEEDKVDSHDCDCVECAETTEDLEENNQSLNSEQ